MKVFRVKTDYLKNPNKPNKQNLEVLYWEEV